MTLLQRVSDRMLTLFVPKTEASAGTFIKFCDCRYYPFWPYAGYHNYYKECWYDDRTGAVLGCGSCYRAEFC